MGVCQTCGRPLGPDATFCSGCGARVAANCPSCGQPVLPGDTTCGRCGAQLQVPRCPSCGAPVAPGNEFCTACGAPLRAPAAQFSGFWRRVGATLVDTFGVYLPVSIVFEAVAGSNSSAVYSFLLLLVVGYGYGAVMIARTERAATLGMRLMGITCRMTDLTRPTWVAACSRVFLRQVFQALLIVAAIYSKLPNIPQNETQLTPAQTHAVMRFLGTWALCSIPLLVDYLSMQFSARRQTLHDRWAHTILVRETARARTLPAPRPTAT